MVVQKRLAVVKWKKRMMAVDLSPRYWAIGVAVGHPNYHVQVGPIAFSITKRLH